MGMLADRYTDDKERGNAMGIALGGLALGVQLLAFRLLRCSTKLLMPPSYLKVSEISVNFF